MEDTQPAPEAVMKFLGSIPLLQRLPSSSVKKIAEVIKFKSFDKGEYLVHEGEVGDSAYFIWKGEVEVSPPTDSEALRHLELVLREGDYFGYGIGSVKETHRADVIALSKVDIFRGITLSDAPMFGNVFGGQLISQALAAASKSVDPLMLAHSLHSYFLRTGDVNLPIIYHIHRIRDGNSFSTRHVVAKQRGHEIFSMFASFQKPEKGFEHHVPMPSAPDPEMLVSRETLLESYLTDPRVPMSKRNSLAKRNIAPWPIEIRFCDTYDYEDSNIPAAREPRQKYWLRARGKLSDDLALHRCVAAFASDLIFLETSLLPHRRKGEKISSLSLDHSMWFHQPFKADEWLLFAMESPIASNGRGFNIGRMYTKSGELVVSVAQEGLIRRKIQRSARL